MQEYDLNLRKCANPNVVRIYDLWHRRTYHSLIPRWNILSARDLLFTEFRGALWQRALSNLAQHGGSAGSPWATRSACSIGIVRAGKHHVGRADGSVA
jgi:hypothetical protein